MGILQRLRDRRGPQERAAGALPPDKATGEGRGAGRCRLARQGLSWLVY